MLYDLAAVLTRIVVGCASVLSSERPQTKTRVLSARNAAISCESRGGYIRTLAWTLAALFCCTPASLPKLYAATLTRDSQAPAMQGVTDVTGGLRYLLRDDDLLVLEVRTAPDGEVETSLTTSDTSNSQLGTPVTKTAPGVNPSTWNTNNGGTPASLTTGRMFVTKSNIVAILYAQNSSWAVSLSDPLTGFSSSVELASGFEPFGTVSTQIVMGDFLGNHLDEPLAYYASNNQTAEWGMKVLYPADVNTEAVPDQGPELVGNNGGSRQLPVPVTGSIVTGDFNGDGKDEIAVLLTDYQTIVFYSVDPKTYQISKINQLKLPKALTPGQATLAAGRFRDKTNAELIAVGQIQGGSAGETIYSIQIATNNSGGFTPTTVQSYQLPNDTSAPVQNVLAQAAPILFPMQTTDQQLIVGLCAPTSVIDIGDFDSSFNFRLHSISNLTTDAGASGTFLLKSMSTGNFDNRNPDGTANPLLQLETLAYLEHHSGIQVPQVTIFNFNPPSQIANVTDWLSGQGVSYNNSGYGTLDGLLLAQAIPGDVQGRSLRLGSPEVVSVYQQIQPDIILGLPPMHVDYVTPAISNDPANPDCTSTAKPCVLNISVLPSAPPSVSPSAFATSFTFSSASDSNSSRKSTTSWGVSVKQTTDLNVSWGDVVAGDNIDVKNSAKYVHDSVVSKTYNTFKGTKDIVTETTGFADHVFFTTKNLNVYYYPVLGQKACPSSEPDCPDSDKQAVYVEFSVPDQVTHADVDGTTLDWYQPVHEPGNVLSYPWNFNQVGEQFVNTPTPLTKYPATCQGIGSGNGSYSTTWTGTTQTNSSSGSTNAFSDDLSMSMSQHEGIEGEFGVNFGFSLDVGGSTSLSTLNENTSSLSASQGFQATWPSSSNLAVSTYDYDYAGYVLGQQNKNPAYQSITVQDPDGNAAGLQATGPLTVAYLADIVPDAQGLDCGGVEWWLQAYNRPDVAVNHPARWTWSKSQQVASFNKADRSVHPSSPLDQAFYQMKGFFITQPGDGNKPTLTTAVAGAPLSLSARIYNFSLVDTNSSTLADPAASVHVRFYGQYLCRSGNSTGTNKEQSCQGPKCTQGNLCGDAFQIGETTLASIPGFKSVNYEENAPNWVMTQPVNFDTTNYGNSNLVFWVVTWMEDAKGNLISEMPGHGLTANPGSLNFTQITQVPIEGYSNNVGLYGSNTPFFICATDAVAACTTSSTSSGVGASAAGTLESVSLSTSKKMLLDSRVKVVANLQATGGEIGPVNVAYYDGNPNQNGQLFDLQRIAHMDPDTTYEHRAFFQPATCGVHKLYLRAWVNDSPDVLGEFTTDVTIQPVDLVSALITATRGADMNPQLRADLLFSLKAAKYEFEREHDRAGVDALNRFIQCLSGASNRKTISVDVAEKLVEQAKVITGCV